MFEDKLQRTLSTIIEKKSYRRKIFFSFFKSESSLIKRDFFYREAHEKATTQCAKLTDFGSRLRDEIKFSDQEISNLVQERIKRDLPTGRTPGRKEMAFPKDIVQGISN